MFGSNVDSSFRQTSWLFWSHTGTIGFAYRVNQDKNRASPYFPIGARYLSSEVDSRFLPHYKDVWGKRILGFGWHHEDMTFTEQDGSGRRLRSYALLLPHWFLILLLGCVVSFWGCINRRWRKRQRSGLCVNCGYDIRATPQRCPECGAKVATLDQRNRACDRVSDRPHRPMLC